MFIIAGPPGAGKTTQCKLLQERLGFIWISAGNLLRQKAEGDARETMLRGDLVNDAYVDRLVEQELNKHQDESTKILLDGFPRDFHEARWLVEDYGATIKAYIIIELNENLIRDRLAARGRVDDTVTAINERLDIFHTETENVVEYFTNSFIPVIRLDGSQAVEEVYTSLKEAMGLDE